MAAGVGRLHEDAAASHRVLRDRHLRVTHASALNRTSNGALWLNDPTGLRVSIKYDSNIVRRRNRTGSLSVAQCSEAARQLRSLVELRIAVVPQLYMFLFQQLGLRLRAAGAAADAHPEYRHQHAHARTPTTRDAIHHRTPTDRRRTDRAERTEAGSRALSAAAPARAATHSGRMLRSFT